MQASKQTRTSEAGRSEDGAGHHAAAVADERASAAQLRRMAAMADASPRMLAQLRVAEMARPAMGAALQLQAQEEEELPAQRAKAAPAAAPRNTTGLPDQLKSGVESLSGMSLDHVKVHYNSSKPAALQAHAYAQGSDIHVGPGQERHLPHEAWHVVQQARGQVKPTMQMMGVPVNDDHGLEHEADVMGAKALAGG